MAENEKDAHTETNLNRSTYKEANPETLGLNLIVGGMDMERKLSCGDRLNKRQPEKQSMK